MTESPYARIDEEMDAFTSINRAPPQDIRRWSTAAAISSDRSAWRRFWLASGIDPPPLPRSSPSRPA